MKTYIVHLDNWAQIPSSNHERETLPFREAFAKAARSLVMDSKTDTARLYPAGTSGWLSPGKEVLAVSRGRDGRLMTRVNERVQR